MIAAGSSKALFYEGKQIAQRCRHVRKPTRIQDRAHARVVRATLLVVGTPISLQK